MIYFFIGTIAELIKVMPVIKELKGRNVPLKIIASGQNDITQSELLAYAGVGRPDFILFDKKITQTPFHLLLWFVGTFFKSFFTLHKEFKMHYRKKMVMVVHGDTVSTVMGALIARCHGIKIAHVEAGLRSFNLLQPFPEEIDRNIIAFISDINFCPNDWAVGNLKNKKGQNINTMQNTLVDSLKIAIDQGGESDTLKKVEGQPYFIFVLHRQENLLNAELTKFLIEQILLSKVSMKRVLILHELTKVTLEKMGLMEKVLSHPDIVVVPRLPYVEFMKVLNSCEYIITDGGSNQEESYYLGKPCLILRKVTERTEGVGQNVVISKNDLHVIQNFVEHHQAYKREKIAPVNRPSEIIADYLSKTLEND